MAFSATSHRPNSEKCQARRETTPPAGLGPAAAYRPTPGLPALPLFAKVYKCEPNSADRGKLSPPRNFGRGAHLRAQKLLLIHRPLAPPPRTRLENWFRSMGGIPQPYGRPFTAVDSIAGGNYPAVFLCCRPLPPSSKRSCSKPMNSRPSGTSLRSVRQSSTAPPQAY